MWSPGRRKMPAAQVRPGRCERPTERITLQNGIQLAVKSLKQQLNFYARLLCMGLFSGFLRIRHAPRPIIPERG